MELSEILNSLTDASSLEKTASASDSGSNLSSAIDRALASGSMEKTASATGQPSGDLMKIASDLANAEEHALVKEAHIYGSAVCDGFMARMGQYENSGGMAKQAAYQQQNTPQDDYMVKQAMELGYRQTMQQLQAANQPQPQANEEQVKVAAFQEGYKDTMTKIAAYNEGFNDTMTKVSAYNEGFNAVMNEANGLTKIAAQFEDYGFQCGNQILSSLSR